MIEVTAIDHNGEAVLAEIMSQGAEFIAGEVPATVVAEDQRTLSFMDINPATRGHALVAGPETDGDLVRGVRKEAAYVFQNYSLLPWLSVLGNVFDSDERVVMANERARCGNMRRPVASRRREWRRRA